MLHDQSLLLGDEEVIGGLKITPVLSLMSMRGATTDAQIDILNEKNADSYWQRSDQFDMGLDLTSGKRGPAALAEAMTRWISHLLGINVSVEPLTELRDAKLTWYIGLDSESTKIGDRLSLSETQFGWQVKPNRAMFLSYERSLQPDLVGAGIIVPIACLVGSRDPGSSASD
jgi:hypothetical protein